MREIHLYGMRQRGYSPGAQPDNGLLGTVNEIKKYDKDIDREFYDVIAYEEPIRINDMHNYDLELLGKLTIYDGWRMRT